MCLHSDWKFHWVGLRHGYLNLNWIRTINGYLDFNRHFNWDVDGYLNRHFNGVGFTDGDLLLNVHRVWPVYWNFHRDGIRHRYSHFNWVGTFNRVWYFNRNSFIYGIRSVYNNWVGMVDGDFDLNRVWIRDRNWDLNGIWSRLRNSNWHFHGIGMVNTHWDFHRVRSINWDFDFYRKGVRDRDFLYYGLNWCTPFDTS
jgi:hypothetical protein